MRIGTTIFRRVPGAEGPLRGAFRRLSALAWGTNTRRTVTALAVTLVFVVGYFAYFRGSPLRLLQISILAVSLVAIIIKPHFGVLALRVYRSLARGLHVESLIKGLGVTMTKSLGVFTLVGFIALLVTKKVRPVFGHKTQLVFLYGLFMATLISAFAAMAWKNVWTHIFQMGQNVILYLLFVNLFADKKWLSRFIWVSLFSLLVACLSGVASVALKGIVRAAGTLGNANGLAMVSNEAAAVLLVLTLAGSELKKKAFYLGGLSLCLVTIILTGSRGGLLTVIVTFTYQLIKRRKNLLPYAAAALVLVGAFVLIPGKYTARQEEWFGAVISGETKEATGGSRGYVYRSALEIFTRSPIIGVGPRTFGRIYQAEYAGEVRGPLSHVKVSHSGFLDILVENGILGFVFFLGLLVSTYLIFRANGRRCRRVGLPEYGLLNDVYEAWFVAVIVSGSFETIIRGGQSFFVALAAAAALHRATVKIEAARAALPSPEPLPPATSPAADSPSTA
ncbi:MAG: O-antigen ligase family protein [Candidatus Zixiibacteriota bacterium]|jgi:O-antigen ligase